MPSESYGGGGYSDYYDYLADSTKIEVCGYNDNEPTRYAGSLVYNNGTFESASFGGGRIVGTNNGANSEVHYFLTDHLGSTRVVAKVTPTGRIDLDRKDYYPFGKVWKQAGLPTSDNRYLFSGKERSNICLEDDYSSIVPLYDFGRRNYYPDGVFFLQQDPLLEKYYSIGQYNYCAGNPITRIDPDGRFISTVIGTIIGGATGAYDACKSGGNIWAGLGEGAVAGLITGAAIDAAVAATIATGGGALAVMGAGVTAGAIGGAAGGIAGDVAGQVVSDIQNESGEINISTENFEAKAVSGAISGMISGVGGAGVGLLGKSVGNATKSIQSTMSESIESTASALIQQGASTEVIGTAVGQITRGMSKVGAEAASTVRTVEIVGSSITEMSTKIIEEKVIVK